jgi:hypothetical protein
MAPEFEFAVESQPGIFLQYCLLEILDFFHGNSYDSMMPSRKAVDDQTGNGPFSPVLGLYLWRYEAL